MEPIRSFHVRPSIPPRLAALSELAYNVRWSWDHETIALFRRLDAELWESSGHNPVQMLGSIRQERLQEVEQDDAFLANLDRVADNLREYMGGMATWHRRTFGAAAEPVIAYFSMEFGLTECIPIYSGGLGMLAGDHLKSASELGLPLIGVGLLYQKGYFRQYLNMEGWQQERHPVNDFSVLPIRPMRDAAGHPVRVTVDVSGGRPLVLRPWSAQVGRITLVLLDTNLPENPEDLRDVTGELYGGDADTRIQQEIVLGIGGVRTLAALGYRPRVYHMNEGHCAFLGLERARSLMKEEGFAFPDALEVVASSGVFTTHTPVPAGIDQFPPDQVEHHLGALREELGLSRDELLDLGRVSPGRFNEPFNMAVLAIRTAGFVNGVSRLHGRVSREMFRELWPGVPVDELPIGHITNGVHPQSWISDDMRNLYDRYLGPRWAEEPGDTRVWARAEEIPGEELWRTHERRRERLVAFARRRLAAQLRARGASMNEVAMAEEVLDPEALTLGFGRRFATYKRGTLLVSDPERLARILNHPERPVQIIFAGKAHPRDEPGKALIRHIVQLARQPELRRRIVFLEDYDHVIARYLVGGADVWVNTPRRPMEASGTSGMKASFNGALNLSVLDGWWDEGYSERSGWAIGEGEDYEDMEYQDRVEAGALYELLEREIVPLFYTRSGGRLPRGWISLMKSAMGELCPVFNTNRMVHQYHVQAYGPAIDRRARLEADGFRRARDLARWKARVRAAWDELCIARVEVDLPEQATIGRTFQVQAWVKPGGLGADELAVQVCVGRLHENRQIGDPEIISMGHVGGTAADELLYEGIVPCRTSGTHGIAVRALPCHPDLATPHETGLIAWAT
jgi:starch phosphorylase